MSDTTVCEHHHLIVLYARPWRQCFRKVILIRCWDCDLRVAE